MSLKFRDYLPLKKSNWYIKVLLPLIYKSPCSIGTALKLCLNHMAWHSNIVKYFLKIVDKLYFAHSHILHDVVIEVHEAVYESV